MPKIYTKTGDQGQCSLGDGRRVFKCDPLIEALGAVDELNAVIGVANQIQKSPAESAGKISKILCQIQKDLFIAGAVLSGARQSKKNLLKTRVKFLEKEIDKLSQDLPELKNFILPGGCQTAAFLHLARAVCRRAERRVVGANVKCQMSNVKSNPNVKDVIMYLNRLSDFLFVLARWANYQTGSEEIKWTAKF